MMDKAVRIRPAEDARPGDEGESASEAPLLSLDSVVLKDVRVSLVAKLGGLDLTLDEILALKPGSALSLDTMLNEPVGLYLSDSLVARGMLVAVGDRFGVRIVDVAPAG